MDTLKAISHFYEQIIQYENLVKEWKNAPSKDVENQIENSRTELQRWYPKLARQISRYSGYKPVGPPGIEIDVFNVAFDSIDQSNCKGKLNALNEIKGIMNKAIGILEAEGESWRIETTSRQRRKTKKRRQLKKPMIKKIYSEAKDIGTTIAAKFLAEKSK